MEMEQCSLSDSPDWAHLPLVVLDLISEKIKSIPDYNRFRAVCSPWRSASLPRPRHHLPPQLPWLMLPYNPHPEWGSKDKRDDGIRVFYDLWESKTRKLHLPETVGMMCCATCRGWLLFVATQGTEVFLLNPITRARIQLPPFTAPVKHLKDSPDDPLPHFDASHCVKSPMGNFAITRVIFSTDLADPDCLITVFLQRFYGIFCCRVGDPCWTMVSVCPHTFEFADAMYYNGFFYMLHKGVLSITDANNPEKDCLCFLDKEFQDGSMFFLHGKPGVFVVHVHDIEEEKGSDEKDKDDPAADEAKKGTEKSVKQKFELYQYQEHMWMLTRTRDPILKLITDTSNITMFLGDNHHGLAVCSDDWESFEGSSMYWEYKRPSGMHGSGLGHYSIYYSKLDDVMFEPVACGLAEEPAIFPPAPAMWFQPSYV